MKWIQFGVQYPPADLKILVYKTKLMGGYDTGYYIAYLHKLYDEIFMVIDDKETNKNNYRLMKEFSHWMPLPNPPGSSECKSLCLLCKAQKEHE